MENLANRVILSWGLRRAGLTILAGAVGALALPPFNFFAAMFISFPLLVWILDGSAASPGGRLPSRFWASFQIGWLFGLGYFTAGLWWLGNALLAEGGEYAWAIPLAALGLPAFLAIFYGFATAFARIYWPDGLGRIAMLAFTFGVVEWLRSFLFTGFPWNAVGYAAMPIPLMMQPVRYIGVSGMNLLAVFVFAMPALIGTKRHMRLGLSLASLLLAAQFGYGYYALRHYEDLPVKSELTVRLVQPVTPLEEGTTDASRNAIFDRLLELTEAPAEKGTAEPSLIVWPETAIPFILTENQDAFSRIAEALAKGGKTLVAGSVRAEEPGPGIPRRYYNSAYVFDSEGQIVSAADKVHLVPFGEYMPFASFLKNLGLDTIAALPGGYTAASGHSLLTLPDGTKLYPLICYEAIFPQEITDAVDQAQALVNLTNDMWFGRTPGPYQHFQAAQVTAVESGKPLIRNANSGISALIGANGEIISGLKMYTSGALDSTIPIKTVPILSNQARIMNYWLLSAVILLIAFFSRVSFKSDMN